MSLKRSSSAAVVSSMADGRPPLPRAASAAGEVPERVLSINGTDRTTARGPALLVGRGFYTPDVVRPQQAEAGSTPEGFALEGGRLSRDKLVALDELESLSLLPLKLGKNPSTSVKSRLTSRPSVGSITRLELSDKEEAAESQQRASASATGSLRRLDFGSHGSSHGPPQLGRGWQTPDVQPSSPDASSAPAGFSLDTSPSKTVHPSTSDGSLPPLIQPWASRESGSSGDDGATQRVALAGPPIFEEVDVDHVGTAEPVESTLNAGMGDAHTGSIAAADGMRRNVASMAALSSMLTGSGEDGADEEPEPEPEPQPQQPVGVSQSMSRLRYSQQSFDSAGTGVFTPSSSGGELSACGYSDDDSPGQMKTNMTRRTSSGTDIHYISFWEGHGGGHLIREDSYQFAGTRRREQAKAERDMVVAKVSAGPLLRFLQHSRHQHERQQRKSTERNGNGSGTSNSHGHGQSSRSSGSARTSSGTAVGAPVHEVTFSTLPDACILRVMNVLGDVKAVLRCGTVCRKLHKLQPFASASFLRLYLQGMTARQTTSGMSRRTLTEIVEGCLRHGVTKLDFCDATQMSSRLLAQLGDPEVLRPVGVSASAPPLPVLQLTQRLQHLILSNNSALMSLEGLQAAVELKHLVLRGCTQLASIEGIGPLVKLQTLDLTWCENISDLSPLGEGHAALKTIALTGCESLKTSHLEPLTLGCAGLEVVRLGGLEYMGSLSLLSGPCSPPATRSGSAKHCWLNLQSLYLNGCKFIEKLTPLGNKLVRADLSFCRALTDTSWLRGCGKLEHLNLAHCARIKTLDGCSDCLSLKSIGLWGCAQVKSVDPLTKCRQLQLVDCTAMVRCPPPAPPNPQLSNHVTVR